MRPHQLVEAMQAAGKNVLEVARHVECSTDFLCAYAGYLGKKSDAERRQPKKGAYMPAKFMIRLLELFPELVFAPVHPDKHKLAWVCRGGTPKPRQEERRHLLPGFHGGGLRRHRFNRGRSPMSLLKGALFVGLRRAPTVRPERLAMALATTEWLRSRVRSTASDRPGCGQTGRLWETFRSWNDSQWLGMEKRSIIRRNDSGQKIRCWTKSWRKCTQAHSEDMEGDWYDHAGLRLKVRCDSQSGSYTQADWGLSFFGRILGDLSSVASKQKHL